MFDEANEFAGKCQWCGSDVEAGAGFRYRGVIYCAQPVSPYLFTCLTAHEREVAVRVEAQTGPEAQARREQRRIASEQAAQEREARKVALAARGLKICVRCNGAGSSDLWANTGRVCYSCNGSGAVAKAGR